MTPVTIILFAVIVVVLIIDYILNKRKKTAIEDAIKKLTTGQSDVVIEQTKQKLDFDILLSRIMRIVALIVVLFGITFFIACKSFIPRYYFNKGQIENKLENYQKANQYWMIFSDQYYPGTEKIMKEGKSKKAFYRPRI
jgi:hypothetical protein